MSIGLLQPHFPCLPSSLLANQKQSGAKPAIHKSKRSHNKPRHCKPTASHFCTGWSDESSQHWTAANHGCPCRSSFAGFQPVVLQCLFLPNWQHKERSHLMFRLNLRTCNSRAFCHVHSKGMWIGSLEHPTMTSILHCNDKIAS